jgi:choline kinase
MPSGQPFLDSLLDTILRWAVRRGLSGMPSPTPRTAVILAAGTGSRLRPLTDDRPKALMPIGSETVLGRAVRLLSEHGVEKIVVATGYFDDAVVRALADLPLEVAFCKNDRFATTQNSVSLALCRAAIGTEAFFKLDGDVVFQGEVLVRLDRSSAALAVAVDATRRADAEAMKVRVGVGRRITALGKQIELEQAAGESIGIERIAAEAVGPLFDALDARIAAGRVDLYYEDVYSELVEQGVMAAEAVEVGDLPWTEIDTPEDLERARSLLGPS